MNQNVIVKISPVTGKVQVWAEKMVVEKVTDSRAEITLADARRIKSDAELGQAVQVESTPPTPAESRRKRRSRLSCNGSMRPNTPRLLKNTPAARAP